MSISENFDYQVPQSTDSLAEQQSILTRFIRRMINHSHDGLDSALIKLSQDVAVNDWFVDSEDEYNRYRVVLNFDRRKDLSKFSVLCIDSQGDVVHLESFVNNVNKTVTLWTTDKLALRVSLV